MKLSQVEALLEDSFYRALDELYRVLGKRKEREEARAAKLRETRKN